MPIQLISGKTKQVKVDARVNFEREVLDRRCELSGSTLSVEDRKQLRVSCRKSGRCSAGDAVIIEGSDDKSKYIIHGVCPQWQDGKSGELLLLKKCYQNVLELAALQSCRSIALPLVSTAETGFPRQESLSIAESTIRDFLSKNEMDIHLILPDRGESLIEETLKRSIEEFILDYQEDDDFVAEESGPFAGAFVHVDKRVVREEALEYKGHPFEEIIENLEDSFQEKLFKYIDESGMDDVEVYKKANMTPKHFSKIRCNKDYRPKKVTVVALAVALELDFDQAQDLLGSAGYILSRSFKFDLIIEYFISRGIYDTMLINETLYEFNEVLLGL